MRIKGIKGVKVRVQLHDPQKKYKQRYKLIATLVARKKANLAAEAAKAK